MLRIELINRFVNNSLDNKVTNVLYLVSIIQVYNLIINKLRFNRAPGCLKNEI